MVSRYIIRGITMAVTLLIASSLCSAQKKRTDWQRDLDSLAVWLPQKHYNLFMYRDRAFFENGIKQLRKDAVFSTDTEMAFKLQQFIVKFGDAHTNVDYISEMSPNRIYPLGLSCYGKDYYITMTTRKNKRLLGSRLIAVNNTPVEMVEQNFASLVVADSRSSIMNIVPNLMAFAQLYEYFNIAKGDSITITYEQNGRVNKTKFKSGPIDQRSLIDIRPSKEPLHRVNAQQLFTETYLPDEKIYYIQYNKCWNRELEERYGSKERAKKLPSFNDFKERIFNTLEEKDIDKIVFDLRYNSGGNSSPFTKLVKQISKKLDGRKDIKCYAVIGRKTFSSGILNTLDIKKYLNAKLVGEETSGCVNHLGEIRNFVLPTSHVSISYSTKYFREEGMMDGPLRPDVLKQDTYSDFIQGNDPVIEWIRQQ